MAGRASKPPAREASVPPQRLWTEDEKAQAVARLQAGESVHAVARSLGVQPSTLRNWRSRLGADPLKAAEGEPDFRALVLHFAVEGLAAGERILGLTRDEAWLKEQRAGEVATLLGVTFDKVARVLAALPTAGDAGWSDAVDTAPGLVDATRGADPTSVEYVPR